MSNISNDKNKNYIYVILKGQYSDRHICAVTTDKERAMQLKKLYGNSYEEAVIESFVDGSVIIENLIDKQYKAYTVKVDAETNSIVSIINETPPADDDDEDSLYSFFDYFKEGIVPYQTRFGTGVIIGLYAKDEEHAKKIAYDKYAQYKAELLQIGI